MTTVRSTLNALMVECLADAWRIVRDAMGDHRTPEAVAIVASALFRARHLDEFGAARQRLNVTDAISCCEYGHEHP